MRILAISGSLRSQSTNTTLLRAMMLVAPPEMEIVLYDELRLMPPFDPDTEEANEFPVVPRFRAALRDADAVVFSTPEYAHGVPGVLKNALDWVVGSGELSEKRVTLVNASPRGVYAQESLREILRTMNARVVTEAEVTLSLMGSRLSAEEIAGDAAMAAALGSAVEALAVSE